jgi:hypothetical protein
MGEATFTKSGDPLSFASRDLAFGGCRKARVIEPQHEPDQDPRVELGRIKSSIAKRRGKCAPRTADRCRRRKRYHQRALSAANSAA